ncbi:MAG: SDR family oxidoreductase [Bacteroidetes bacterium]|nr:SDR family oxidoreductase [Bacteroidota bacterium]
MKTVLITGSNRGIGYEIARQLGNQRFLVYLTARDKGKGEYAMMHLRGLGIECRFVQLDVSDVKSIEAAYHIISKCTDRLDVLVNNAGIMPQTGSILDIRPKALREVFDTNTFGPLHMVQVFLPMLKEGSRVINISSGLGKLSSQFSDYSPAYGMSKTALNTVTLRLAHALKGKGIAVNSVCPGWVQTDMGGPNAQRTVDKGADTAVWLATEAPAELTGKFFRDRQETVF